MVRKILPLECFGIGGGGSLRKILYTLMRDDMHAYGVMRYKGGSPPLMIYQACGLDKKITKLSLRYFL